MISAPAILPKLDALGGLPGSEPATSNQQPTKQRKDSDMATPKKPAKAKAQVKVKDLNPKKNTKGGDAISFIKSK